MKNLSLLYFKLKVVNLEHIFRDFKKRMTRKAFEHLNKKLRRESQVFKIYERSDCFLRLTPLTQKLFHRQNRGFNLF